MKNIYYISGLGADKRVFKNLTINNSNETHIEWLKPLKRENISEYSTRLIQQIDTENPVILIGVSFGGIIVQEIEKQIKVEKTIIISSVKLSKEFDFLMKLASITKIHKVAPAPFLKWINLLTGDYFFSIKNKEESELLKLIIKETDNEFLLWAVNEIMCWKNENKTSGIIHIQGDKDRIFRNRNIENVKWIKNGGHFMIMNKALEISEIINNELKN